MVKKKDNVMDVYWYITNYIVHIKKDTEIAAKVAVYSF